MWQLHEGMFFLFRKRLCFLFKWYVCYIDEFRSLFFLTFFRCFLCRGTPHSQTELEVTPCLQCGMGITNDVMWTRCQKMTRFGYSAWISACHVMFVNQWWDRLIKILDGTITDLKIFSWFQLFLLFKFTRFLLFSAQFELFYLDFKLFFSFFEHFQCFWQKVIFMSAIKKSCFALFPEKHTACSGCFILMHCRCQSCVYVALRKSIHFREIFEWAFTDGVTTFVNMWLCCRQALIFWLNNFDYFTVWCLLLLCHLKRKLFKSTIMPVEVLISIVKDWYEWLVSGLVHLLSNDPFRRMGLMPCRTLLVMFCFEK